jgi:hypothetical protein
MYVAVYKTFNLGELIEKHKIPMINKGYHRGRRGHDRMVVGFTTTYAISAFHH